jgi:hypothetical protein
MPKEHRKHTRHAKHQGKGEKIPLFPEKIYIGIAKELHLLSSPLSIYDLAPAAGRALYFSIRPIGR